MTINTLINQYGRAHSPYVRGLVNHLPMGQLALYKLSQDMERVEDYSKAYAERAKIDPVKEEYEEVATIEECLGKRDLYEACLVLIKEKLKEGDPKKLVSQILNTYPLGMSSGLFHSLIRLAYAVEGYESSQEGKEEVARALAYYITAYREGRLLTREVEALEIDEEMEKLLNNPKLKVIRESDLSLGQKLKSLYESDEYLKEGFTIKASQEEKIQGFLALALKLYLNSLDIVILHCITGFHALLVLKEYFDDFDKALDIYTSLALTHSLTLKGLGLGNGRERLVDFSWKNLISMAIDSPDVHTLKFTYSCSELAKSYDLVDLKRSARWRITEPDMR